MYVLDTHRKVSIVDSGEVFCTYSVVDSNFPPQSSGHLGMLVVHGAIQYYHCYSYTITLPWNLETIMPHEGVSSPALQP